jgi:hypothetical protein
VIFLLTVFQWIGLLASLCTAFILGFLLCALFNGGAACANVQRENEEQGRPNHEY